MISDSVTSKKSTCLICDSADVEIFIELFQVPVHCNVLWKTREEALHAPRGDIQLGFCNTCGYIFNVAFDPDLMKYTQEYENPLDFSPRFQEYAKSLATRLIQDHRLYNKDIIEIGCGKGDFLLLLCKLGQNRGIGFDTSYEPGRIDNIAKDQLTFIQDFYSERYANYPTDLLCCRHVLEHIQFPRDFLNTIRRTIGKRLHTVLYFEVPNVMFTLKDLGIWDLIYEHRAYFSKSSLAHVFTSCGFKVVALEETFEDQFLGIDALPVEALPHSDKTLSDPADEKMADYVAAFAERYQHKVNTWQEKLESMKHAGHRVVVWGAGSKGVTFLNTLKIQDQINYIVDINPHKHGMYVAGTGQKIVSPEFLRDYRPDIVVVMNPVYLDEIGQLTKEMNLSSECIVV